MSPSATVAPAPDGCLLGLPDHDLPVVAVHKGGEDGRPEEEDDLHDAQREARLQHGARLVEVERQGVPALDAPVAKGPEGDVDLAAVPARAVRAPDEAQLVDAGDEGAEEAQVDEGDEGRGALGGRVADQGVEGPEDGDDADDEEDEDVGRGHDVGFDVSIDEVGLHYICQQRQIVCDKVAAVLTSMPMIGIRKVISTIRQKMKKRLPNILDDVLFFFSLFDVMGLEDGSNATPA